MSDVAAELAKYPELGPGIVGQPRRGGDTILVSYQRGLPRHHGLQELAAQPAVNLGACIPADDTQPSIRRAVLDLSELEFQQVTFRTSACSFQCGFDARLLCV